ncbi:MAG: hypothetical protein QOI04_2307 [Verrucomicrobiota bacterium]
MGLAFSTVSFLLDAYERGASFGHTLTIGRAQLYLRPSEIQKFRKLIGRELSPAALDTKFGGYADAFLQSLLQIQTLEALDYSPGEGATIVHDMNLPVPPELEGKFDAVIDCGTIEHVFNFPVAIANCMKMVRLGGRLFLMTVANNHCGHGFYQFSPEVFFRLFKDANGFQIERLLLLHHPFPGLELSSKVRDYSVKDPDEIGYRVGLVTSSPVMLLLEARRSAIETIMSTYPLQSDYTALWHSRSQTGKNMADNQLPHGLIETLRKFYYSNLNSWMGWPGRRLAMFIAGLFQREFLFSFRNRKYYQPSKISKADDASRSKVQ